MNNEQNTDALVTEDPVKQPDTQGNEQTSDSPEAQDSLQESPTNTPQKPRKNLKKLVVTLLIVLLFVVAIGTTYYFTKKSTEKQSVTPSPATEKVDTKPTGAENIDTLPKSGYTWLSTPQKVAPLPIFNNIAGFLQDPNREATETDATYYKIGAGPQGFIYVVKFPGAGGLGPGDEQLVVQAEGSSYLVLMKHSPSFYFASAENTAPTYSGPELAVDAKLDTTTEINDIKTPIAITYKNQKLLSSQSPTYNYFDRGRLVETTIEDEYKGSTIRKEADITEGTLYEVIDKDETDYRISRFVLLLKSHFALNLKLDGELSRVEVEPITWSNGSINDIDFASGAQGCGQGQNNEIAKVSIDQLKQIGKTTGGQKIYGFASESHSLVVKHYDEYAQFKGESYVEEAHRNLTIEQYIAKPELFLVEDGLGRFLVFESTKTRFSGGCAKPVVYLYPTTPTLVHVSVGADVTVSEPQYTSTGWDNVLAMPNGLLGYNGKQYDSLFWEGYGKGEYPTINEGFVVARGEAITTMKRNLSELGLNEKESSDFMQFWGSKIPSKPWVRLTWLGTESMDKLAPLYVSPAPTTRIRVFLDMEGLDTHVQLPEQSLNHLARRGFTVVEWGGLARDGSVPLLR